jgi:hypothetical protein
MLPKFLIVLCTIEMDYGVHSISLEKYACCISVHSGIAIESQNPITFRIICPTFKSTSKIKSYAHLVMCSYTCKQEITNAYIRCAQANAKVMFASDQAMSLRRTLEN